MTDVALLGEDDVILLFAKSCFPPPDSFFETTIFEVVPSASCYWSLQFQRFL